jgi:hypothetical protein
MQLALMIAAIWSLCSLGLVLAMSAAIRRDRELKPQRVPVRSESVRQRV